MPKPTRRDGGAVAQARSRFRRADSAASSPPPDRTVRTVRTVSGEGPPAPENTPTGRFGRFGRSFLGGSGLTREVARFIQKFVVLDEVDAVVLAAWIVATRAMGAWDRFPHVAVTSPVGRCGKTRLLDVIELLSENPLATSNVSPAVVYRTIQAKKPVLLIDEAQSLSRRGSESSEVLREILCAGIDRGSKVLRCSGEDHEVTPFSIYCAKAIALIGQPDAVLADRCLTIRLKRKTPAQQVERWVSRRVTPKGKDISGRVTKWAARKRKKLTRVYEELEPLPIQNDRMAECLLPLETVVRLDAPELHPALVEYARRREEAEREAERESPAVLLLWACREIFDGVRADGSGRKFIATSTLIARLVGRREGEWSKFTRGGQITPHALAGLLRPYGIKPGMSADRRARGYHAADFAEAWASYCG